MTAKNGQKNKSHYVCGGAIRFKSVKGPSRCDCRRSKRGRPHVAAGMCKTGLVAERVRERHEQKRYLHEIAKTTVLPPPFPPAPPLFL